MSTFKTVPSVDVFMSSEAYLKQQALIRSCPTEVAWVGEVDEREIGDYGRVFYVTDIHLFGQEVSMASTEQLGDDLLQWMMANPELASRCNYYGHSHVNMDVYTSHVDLRQILNWREYGVPYMINYIGNKLGEHWLRLDQFSPRETSSSAHLLVDTGDVYREWARDSLAEHVVITQWDSKQKRDKVMKPKGSYAYLS